MTAAAAKLILLSLISFTVLVQARDDDDNPFEQSSNFWDGLDEEEEPYEHDFTQIPDLINN